MKKAWFMVILSILAAITCGVVFFKVPPTMVLLMQTFGISLTIVGLTMAVPTFTQLIVTLPFGVILEKIGTKKTMFIMLGFGIAGNVFGALSTSYPLMLAARIFDGVCFAVSFIVVPKIISIWFPPQKRGFPMGLFTIYVPLSELVIFNAANPVSAAFTWRGLWWFCAILNGIGIILTLMLKNPKEGEGYVELSDVKAKPGQKTSISAGFKSYLGWIVGIIYFLTSCILATFATFYSTYLVQAAGLVLGTANKIFGFSIIGGIIGGMISGVMLNKLNKKYHAIILTICFVPLLVICYYMFRITSPDALVPFLLVTGIFITLPVPIIFTIGPNVANRSEEVGPILGIINFFNSIAGMTAPLVVGPLVIAFGGWSGLSLPLLIVAVLAVIACLILQKGYSRKFN
jgi:MFS family permease